MPVTLQPLRIGRLKIAFPFVLAPLAGYTDVAFRLICREHSAEYAATGVMLDKLLLQDNKLRREIIKTDPADHPVAGQIMGSEPDIMARAAAVVVETGFDVVDLNFACPVRKVLSRRRGGYLMQVPDRALAIVKEVIAAVPGVPVTVKLRRTFHEEDTGNAAFWKMAEGCFELGVSAVCVHARSVECKYTGKADQDFLASVKRAFPTETIIGSGDALTPELAFAMLGAAGVDGVSVARGVIGNPWIFDGLRALAAGKTPEPPGLDEQRRVLLEHYELERKYFGDEKAWRRMRNFGIMYARRHPRSREVRMAFVPVRSSEAWLKVIEDHYVRPVEEAPAAGPDPLNKT